MASGVSGTRRTPVQEIMAEQGAPAKSESSMPNLEAAKDMISSQTYNLIKHANNTYLSDPVYKEYAMSLTDAMGTDIEKIAKSNDIYTGSKKIETVLNAAPIGTVIEYDAFQSGGETLQMQYERTSANTWTGTWRNKKGKIHWTNKTKVGPVADDLWNHYNGSHD